MNTEPTGSGEILLYNNGGEKQFVGVVFKDENFWLTQSSMAELFDCTSENIIQHLKNIYSEERSTLEATAEKFLVVRQEGARSVRREIDNYNLDAIIAVGYRAYQKIADVFEQCSYDCDKNSDTTKAFYAFAQNKLHFAATGKQDADYISEFDRETAKYLKGGELK